MGFPGRSVVKNLPASEGDGSSVPGWGRALGGGNGCPLKYSCRENPMDRGACPWARQRAGRDLVTKQQRMVIIQFSSVAQSCLSLCNPMDCLMPGFPVHHQLPELAQTHVHRASNAIQPSHPLLSPSPPAFNLSQHQGLSQ